MGYPMSYRRAMNRNNLWGGYDGVLPGGERDKDVLMWANLYDPPREGRVKRPTAQQGALDYIAGDLRRVEQDQRDPKHLPRYAERAGITEAQAKAVLDAFFEEDW